MRALVLVAIILFSITYFGSTSSARAATVAAIPTEGGAWADPAVTIVITPQLDAPWFKPSFSSDVSRAITRWTGSIIVYTDTYGSGYLRKLSFLTYIAGVNQSIPANPDIQIGFIQTFLGAPYPLGLGVTLIPKPINGAFQGTTTTRLAGYDPTNTTQLTDNDMVNIASHEFGHALGLDHATVSTTDDGTLELMFRSYGQGVGNPANSLEAASTLDIYTLSYIYYWLASSSTLSGQGRPVTLLSLPSGVSYSSMYPYPEQLQMLQSLASRLNLEIIILAIVAALLLALVLVLVILLSPKRPVQAQTYSWQIVEPPEPSG